MRTVTLTARLAIGTRIWAQNGVTALVEQCHVLSHSFYKWLKTLRLQLLQCDTAHLGVSHCVALSV